MAVQGPSDGAARPLTCIAIFDKTPQMPLLYVTSGIRQSMHMEPRDIIGRPSSSFIEAKTVGSYKEASMAHSADSVITIEVPSRTPSGELRYMRVLRFNCDNIVASLCITNPAPAPESAGPAPLNVHVYRSAQQGPVVPTAPPLPLPVHRQPRGAVRYARTPTKACLVLEGLLEGDPDDTAGPRVLFASASFARILDVDPCDLQGVAFLALVAAEDAVAAARFLEKMSSPDRLVLDQLRFLHCPVADDRLHPRRTVLIEVLGAGSDDGAIILCQLSQSDPEVLRTSDDEYDGYLSLEEMISSDPDSSDIGDAWLPFR
ncbi:hypothetical protein H4R19_002451 [Coemansia spiralis]|nr:hypothetical protein H4R19_002451 [Coemansia spiralis]